MCSTLTMTDDFDLQEAKYLRTPYRLKPRHTLRLDCVYDSTSRNFMTHGGDATEDEMCIMVLFYNGPEVDGHLLSRDVTLDSGSGTHTCGYTEQQLTNGASATNGSSGSDCAFSGPSVAADGYDYDRGARMLKLHAGLMLWAWGLLLPMGAIVPRFWRAVLGRRWLYVHLTFQLGGLGLVFAGLYASIDATEALLLPHFDSSAANGHKVLGLLVICLAALQLLGLVRPHKAAAGQRDTLCRQLWAWSHRLGGIAALGLALAQIWTGTDQIHHYTDEYDHTRLIYFALLAVAVGLAVLGLCLTKSGVTLEQQSQNQSRKNKTSKIESEMTPLEKQTF